MVLNMVGKMIYDFFNGFEYDFLWFWIWFFMVLNMIVYGFEYDFLWFW